MKKIFLLSIIMLLVLSLAACSGSDSTTETPIDSNSSTQEEVTLTILVEAGGPGGAVAEATKAEFEAAHPGVTIVIDPVPYGGIYEKILTEIKTGNVVHDVVTLDVLWLAAFQNGLVSLGDQITSDMAQDFLPTMLEGGTLNGNLLGMPMWINSKVLMYRPSYFEDNQNMNDFKAEYGYDLAVPTTWEEYIDVAQFFTNSNDSFYGTAVYGANNGDTVCSWLDFASQAGAGPLILDGNKVNVDEQPYIDAINFMKEQYDLGIVPEDSLSNASGEVINYYNNGQLAMMLNWSHFYPGTLDTLDGDSAVAPMIGGSAGIGATTGPWYESVLKDSPNKDLAVEYLKFMYDKNENYMQEFLKIAGRTSVYEKYAKIEGNEHLDAVLTTLGAPASGNRPNTPYWTEIEQILADAINAAMSGKISAEDAMIEAKAEIESILN